MKKMIASVSVLLMFFSVFCPSSVFAEGFKEGASSLLLPTTGQALNGEIGTTKTKIMGAVEVAAITTVTILGFAAGGPVIWVGAGPLIANHIWSATDAYKGAKNKRVSIADQQMMESQRNIDLSRQRRFEREQEYRSDIRDRIQRVREQAYEES